MKTNQLPAYRITLQDGSSYVTSMAQGITLNDAKSYFMGQLITQSDEKTRLAVVDVAEVPQSIQDWEFERIAWGLAED